MLRGMQIRFWVVAIIIFILFSSFNYIITLYTDWLWFEAVGYEQIFITEIWAKISLFLIVAIFFVVLFLLNVYLARWQIRRNTLFFSDESLIMQQTIIYTAWGVALVLAWLVGSVASANWLSVLQYVNQVPFGEVDPIFNRDIGFYVFSLPLLGFVQDWVVIVLFLSLFGAAGVYLLEQRNNLEEGRIVILPHVQLHLSILGALIFLGFAVGHWLDGFDLVYSPRGVVFGGSYTDINVVLPILRILMVIALLSAILLVVNIFVQRQILPIAAIFIWLIAGFVLRGVIPNVVQRFVVEPNELAREEEYINYNIEFTNQAYGLHEIEERPFSEFRPLTAADIDDNVTAIENIRLWDPRTMRETFQQLQALRLYYTFTDVDLDRYNINGTYRQVALSVRELDKTQLQSQSWVNQRLQFTHGYGVVVNPVNEVTREGLPNFWVKDLPPQSLVEPSLIITQAEIYYGENIEQDDYVFVNTEEPEVDYPGEGEEVVYTNYAGQGGVLLDSWLKRVAFALRFGDSNIILSNDITQESRVMLHRRIKERLEKIAPFLTYDPNSYIVVGDNGKLYWLQDAYTTSRRYPYSTQTQDSLNYIRNSVKIVIDPYQGKPDFYLFDEGDPLVQTISQIFPDLFQPASDVPEMISSHFRYPEKMFAIQAQLYQTYHMRDSKVFYNKEDLWALPKEKFYGNSEQEVSPYYLITRLPDEETDEFLLIQPFTPDTKANLIAWMAARSDGDNYGQIIVYRFSKQELIFGPQQIEARIDQDSEISPQFSLWDQGGSEVNRGNLLILPIAESLLYVEPIYLQAETGEIPELKRVIMASGDQVIMRETLLESLNDLLGSLPETIADTIQTGGNLGRVAADEDGLIDQSVRQLVESATANYEAAQDALQAGDWAGYGEALEALEQDLSRLQRAVSAEGGE